MELIRYETLVKNIVRYGRIFSNLIEDIPNDLPQDYLVAITKSNGGYTEDRFLHFFGTEGPLHHNIVEWNKKNLWKQYYDLKDHWFIFAEDIFGGQYFFKRGGRRNAIYVLDSTTGNINYIADTYNIFLELSSNDEKDINRGMKTFAHSILTLKNSDWIPFEHLSCTIPIYLGGDGNDPSNYEFCDSVVNLSINGQLLKQLKDVPVGTVIKDVKIDYINKKASLIF